MRSLILHYNFFVSCHPDQWCQLFGDYEVIYSRIQVENQDFTPSSYLGRGFLSFLLHVQMHKTLRVWLKLFVLLVVCHTCTHTCQDLESKLRSYQSSFWLWQSLLAGGWKSSWIARQHRSSSGCEITAMLQGREWFLTSERSVKLLRVGKSSNVRVSCGYTLSYVVLICVWSYLSSSWKRLVNQGNLKLPEHILPPYCGGPEVITSWPQRLRV